MSHMKCQALFSMKINDNKKENQNAILLCISSVEKEHFIIKL